MTEIPEHLLKKAAEARAKREGAAGPTSAGDEAAAETVVADSGAEEEITESDEQAEAALAILEASLGDDLLASHIEPYRGLWVRVAAANWRSAVTCARDELDCKFFDFLSVIDWMPSPYGRELETEQDLKDSFDSGPMEWGYAGGASRFQMLCRVHSLTRHFGVIFKADLDDQDPRIPTLVSVYAGANWHEREAIEMFGIAVDGHPDVRNLYLPGGFEGYPLRKDYPLLSRRIKPWPGIVDVELMPGDES